MDIDLLYQVRQIADLPGHTDRAWQITWNPAKPLLASCSSDKTVRIYAYSSSPDSPDLKFRPITSIPTGHAKTVRSVTWSPSGETLATASFDSNIGIWEQEKDGEDEEAEKGEWECISTLEGHETECKSVAYSPEGTLLASCSRDKTVWIWEVHPDGEFETISVLMEHSQDVKCVAFHPKEEILASASYDDTIKLYIEDPSDDWYCFATLEGHESTVWSLAWSPLIPVTATNSAGYLASSSDDNTIRIWKRVSERNWECVAVLAGHERSVYSISWGRGLQKDEEGKGKSLGWLASASGDGKVLIWELNEPIEEASPSKVAPPKYCLIAAITSTHGIHDVNSIAWCPRVGYEDLLATTGDDGNSRVWKVVPNL